MTLYRFKVFAGLRFLGIYEAFTWLDAIQNARAACSGGQLGCYDSLKVYWRAEHTTEECMVNL